MHFTAHLNISSIQEPRGKVVWRFQSIHIKYLSWYWFTTLGSGPDKKVRLRKAVPEVLRLECHHSPLEGWWALWLVPTFHVWDSAGLGWALLTGAARPGCTRTTGALKELPTFTPVLSRGFRVKPMFSLPAHSLLHTERWGQDAGTVENNSREQHDAPFPHSECLTFRYMTWILHEQRSCPRPVPFSCRLFIYLTWFSVHFLSRR